MMTHLTNMLGKWTGLRGTRVEGRKALRSRPGHPPRRQRVRLKVELLEARLSPAALIPGIGDTKATLVSKPPTPPLASGVLSSGSVDRAPPPAFDVHGPIRDKWLSLGGASGFLGLPTTDEQAAARGGRFQHFQGGSCPTQSVPGLPRTVTPTPPSASVDPPRKALTPQFNEHTLHHELNPCMLGIYDPKCPFG
jgi:hypothetical protein